MTESRNNLSPVGQRRREAILKVALRDASERRYTRIERRLGAVIVLAVCLTGTLIVKHRPNVLIRAVEIAKLIPQSIKTSGLKPAAEELIQIVQTDPSIVERLSIKPEPPRWKVICDDELLATLQAAGRPAGLVEIDGKTRIVFR